jgi:hypothetical protein
MISKLIIVFLVLMILFVATYITKSKEYFNIVLSGELKDLLTNTNENIRETTRDNNKKAYEIQEYKNLDEIERKINSYESIFENIRVALSKNAIPICRTIDLKQQYEDPLPNITCPLRSETKCTLNPYCELGKDPNDINKNICKSKTFNNKCRDILEPDTNSSTGYKANKMYLSPTMMKEVTELSIIK